MRKFLLILLAVGLFADSFQLEEQVVFRAPDVANAIGVKEDPQARVRFERMQLVNPATGTLPDDIRQKELQFSKGLQSKEQLARQKNGARVTTNWNANGPFNVGGRTRAGAFDVQDPTGNVIIAAGVSGGIWKTTNKGESWTRTSDPALRNSITSVAQDTREGKENVWYAGTGELLGNSARASAITPFRGDGLFKSIDNGDSWTQISSTKDSDPSNFGSQFQYIWRVVTDHTDLVNDVVLAAAYGGILRSTDGGDSWSVVLGKELFNLDEGTNLNEIQAAFFTDIEKTPSGNFYAYMSAIEGDDVTNPTGGIYFSEDGIEWNLIASSPAPLNWDRVVMDFQDWGGYVFTSAGSQTNLFRYDFQGTNEVGVPIGQFENLTGNLPNFEANGALNTQQGYNMTIKVHPTYRNLVLLGATNLYRSTDGFSTPDNISWVGGYREGSNGTVYENHHPDQHDVLFDPLNTNAVITLNDGGVFISYNIYSDQVSWVRLNNGYTTSQFYTVHIPKSEDSGLVVGGLQDNGTYVGVSADSADPWVSVLGGDGSYCSTVPGGFYWYFSAQEGLIYRFFFGSESTQFARVDPLPGPDLTGSQYLFINPFVLDPGNHNVMYLAGGNAIWKNSNLAQIPSGSNSRTDVNWKMLSESLLDSGIISSIEITHNSDYLYLGTSTGEVYRLDDLDETPQLTFLRDFGDLQYVSAISSSADNDDEVMVIISNYGVPSIYHSENAGQAFTDVSGNLEEFPDGSGNGPSIRWSEIVPMADGSKVVYVGTSVGLYSSVNLDGNATSWVKEAETLVGNAVIRMMDYRASDGTLVVASHGNGVFRTQVPNHKEINPSVSNVPEKFAASTSYPNPFSDETQIEFEIPETEYLKVDIYDMQGNYIRNLFLGPQFAGKSSVTWDGKNQHGEYVKDGMYIFRIFYDGKIKGGRVVYNRSL